jgi:hypothetical protein
MFGIVAGQSYPASEYFSIDIERLETKFRQQIKEHPNYFWVTKASLKELIKVEDPYDPLEFQNSYKTWLEKAKTEVYKISARTFDNHDANNYHVLGDLLDERFDNKEEALEAIYGVEDHDLEIDYEVVLES